MRDHEAGAPLEQPGERRLDQPLGVAVDARGRFVQDQDPRVGDQRAGEADQLPLPEREVAAALLQRRLVALRQAHDEVVRADGPGRVDHLLAASPGVA